MARMSMASSALKRVYFVEGIPKVQFHWTVATATGLADMPGLGEVIDLRARIRDRSRALASHGSSLLGGFRDGFAVVVILFGRHSTLNSELAQTRGIRPSN